jgi:transporter family-2 protein
MQAVFFVLAMVAGLSNPIQSAANATLNKTLGHPLLAVVIIYAVAVAALLLGLVVTGTPARLVAEKAGNIPWWAYGAGICNLVFAFAGATATQKIGSGAFTVTVLVTAVVLSIVLDHYGWLGLPVRPATWPRMIGAALAIGGVTMVSLL